MGGAGGHQSFAGPEEPVGLRRHLGVAVKESPTAPGLPAEPEVRRWRERVPLRCVGPRCRGFPQGAAARRGGPPSGASARILGAAAEVACAAPFFFTSFRLCRSVRSVQQLSLTANLLFFRCLTASSMAVAKSGSGRKPTGAVSLCLLTRTAQSRG